MEQLYIGIDIGTTATKAVCFNKKGNVIRQFSKEYAIYHTESDRSTQKPAEIVAAVIECIQKITQDFTPEFISFSAAMQSLVVIDESGIPIGDAMLWADNRANKESLELNNSDQGALFYNKTGIPIHPFSPMAKIDWMRKNDVEIFSKASKFISIKEYVWHQLTGEYVIDSSLASGTGILNIHTLKWDSDILDFLQIQSGQLSEIVSPMHQSKGISDSFLYIIGGGDGPLANLGSGAMEKGNMALTIGTSGAVRIPVNEPFIDSQRRTQCYHLMENQYLKLGAVNNGAIVLQWLKESILNSDESFEALFELAKEIPAGSDGLLFVPYLLGERAPIWDASAQGSLLGISINHSKAHFIRATLEGILFGLFSVVETLMPDLQKRQETTVMASGGFGKSELWLQMVADIFQMKVVVSSTIESGTWGAVLIGFKAIGVEIPSTNTIKKIFLPDYNNKIVYKQSFEKFKQTK